MPKPSRKKKITQAPPPQPISKTIDEAGRARRIRFFIISVVVVIILIIAGAIYYQTTFAPFQQAVVSIDKTTISMDYFLKRTRISGISPTSVLQQIVDEQLIKIRAPDYGITATPQEIDNALLFTSSSQNITGNLADNTTGRYLTESEFKTWYAGRLKSTGLTDAEYRDLTATGILAAKLQQYLASQVPTSAQQVHLNVVVTASSADALAAKARIQAGENFTAVAQDVSLDDKTRAQGGDIGWIPRGVLPYDDTLFALTTGIVSSPVAVNPSSSSTQYLLFMVSEKAALRPIDASVIQTLKDKALSNWFLQESPQHAITLVYDFNNAANQAWIDWQLSQIKH